MRQTPVDRFRIAMSQQLWKLLPVAVFATIVLAILLAYFEPTRLAGLVLALAAAACFVGFAWLGPRAHPAAAAAPAVPSAPPQPQSRIKEALLYAKIHHDMLSPLTLLKQGLAALSRAEADEPAARAQFERSAKENIAQLEIMIDQLGDAARIASGVWETPPAELLLRAVLEECQAIVLPFAQKQKVEVRIDPGDEPGKLRGHRPSLRRVVVNLLTNAIKACYEGGIVRVGLRREHSDSREWVVIEVRDTGRGMSGEQAAGLFQRGWPANRDEGAVLGGSGLGLLICDELCRRMGGRLRVAATAPGQGTTMEVQLPCDAGTTAVR
jgi:two-component system capsular synthesis sensor histidine kinase RcsC